MIYAGKKVQLNPEQEEMATFYAGYLGTEHVKKRNFNANFWQDWKKVRLVKGVKGEGETMVKVGERRRDEG